MPAILRLDGPPLASMTGLRSEPDLDSGSRISIDLLHDRESFLEQLSSRHSRVAHIGCTDSPYTDYRIASGGLLHSRLVSAGNSEVVGIDIDVDALAKVAVACPGAELVALDVSVEVPDEYLHAFDLVIAGEVTEHVPNVGAFLRGCRSLLRSGGVMCVTVPNACSPKIGLRAIMGRESVHPDHHYYFGPRTLTRALMAAGFAEAEISTYLARPSAFGRLANVGLRLAHAFRRGPVGEGLIALAR